MKDTLKTYNERFRSSDKDSSQVKNKGTVKRILKFFKLTK